MIPLTLSRSRRILVYPMNLLAHYLRCIELSNRLNESDILFADSSTYHNYLGKAGYNVFKAENFDPLEVNTGAAEFNFNWMNKKTLNKVLDSQIETIREYKPDLVIGDTAFTLKMAAEATNTRYVSLLNAYMTKHYIYARGVSRNHPGYKYSKLMPAVAFEIISREIEHQYLVNIHEPYRQIRQEHRLSKKSYLLDELEGDYNLVCDLPELYPLKEPPPNYQYIGPLFHSNNEGEEDAKEFLGETKPRILLTTGSTGKGDYFDALNDPLFRDYKMIATGDLGKRLKGLNVLGKSFIKHCAVLPQIDLVLCHGGNGTIYQALSYGVPVLCHPNNFEQEWNSSRVELAGYGAVMNNYSTPKDIKILIDSWIQKKGSDPFIKTKEEIIHYLNKPINLKMG
jgi:UDP:flavonoid glycosyltransferase YjiC (YdhE family)